MDLLDWHRDRLSARRLSVLVKHLPRDSALNRELHGEGADWSVTDHLLAAAVDHLAAANWMFACVNSEEGDQPEAPTPVPRPQYRDEEGDAGELGEEEPGGAPQPSAAQDGRPPLSPSQLAHFFG
ncbi:hypothetical protein GO605_03135 [Streptomyces murinus]|nr:hypothetical protein [Streptomyces murinus]UWW89949.1 hypothetical protein GO605_03135 [Streptomyces murinus]